MPCDENEELVFDKKASYFSSILRYKDNEYRKGKSMRKKLVIITGNDIYHMKCNFIDGSFVNGIRQAIQYHFALDKPTAY